MSKQLKWILISWKGITRSHAVEILLYTSHTFRPYRPMLTIIVKNKFNKNCNYHEQELHFFWPINFAKEFLSPVDFLLLQHAYPIFLAHHPCHPCRPFSTDAAFWVNACQQWFATENVHMFNGDVWTFWIANQTLFYLAVAVFDKFLFLGNVI